MEQGRRAFLCSLELRQCLIGTATLATQPSLRQEVQRYGECIFADVLAASVLVRSLCSAGTS